MGMTKVWVSGMLLSLAKCSWTHTFNLSHATTLYCALRVDYMCVCLPQRLFRVPPVPGKHIPYTRVNHNKYMVTDNAAYVSELYKNTCLKQLRDWRKKDGTINWRLLIKAEELSMKRDITRNSSIFIFPSLVPLPSDFLCCFPFLLCSLPFVSPSLLPLATSNWSADYWNDTGGLSLTFNQTSVSPPNATLQCQLAQVFLRDWNSPYAMDIQDYVNLIH